MLVNMGSIEEEFDKLEKELDHIKQQYLNLNQGLYDIGFYDDNMDKESIQESLMDLLSKEYKELYMNTIKGIISWTK